MPAQTRIETEDARPAFGSRVLVTATLDRRATRDRATGIWHARWHVRQLPEPRIGLLIGYRTLSNGTLVSGLAGLESYARQESVRAALVVFGPRSATVYAPVDAVRNLHGMVDLGHGLTATYVNGQLTGLVQRTGLGTVIADD